MSSNIYQPIILYCFLVNLNKQSTPRKRKKNQTKNQRTNQNKQNLKNTTIRDSQLFLLVLQIPLVLPPKSLLSLTYLSTEQRSNNSTAEFTFLSNLKGHMDRREDNCVAAWNITQIASSKGT